MFVKLITPTHNLKTWFACIYAGFMVLWMFQHRYISSYYTEPHHHPTNTTSNSADELKDSLLDFADELLQLNTLSEDMLTADV